MVTTYRKLIQKIKRKIFSVHISMHVTNLDWPTYLEMYVTLFGKRLSLDVAPDGFPDRLNPKNGELTRQAHALAARYRIHEVHLRIDKNIHEEYLRTFKGN